MNKIQKNSYSVNDNGKQIEVGFPQIDKLSMVVYPDKALHGVAYATVLELLEQKEKAYANAKRSARYPLAVKLLLPLAEYDAGTKPPHLLLQFTSKKTEKPQIRLEYNPAYVSDAAKELLDVEMTSLLGVTFSELLHHAKITRIDWCIDLYGVHIEEYLYRATWWKAVQIFCGTETGRLQSMTYGKSSGNQALIYDKATELFGTDTAQQITRIEIRNRTGCEAKQLAKAKYPFKRLQLYPTHCKLWPFSKAHYHAFRDSCHLRGIKNAIKMQPANTHKKIAKALSDAPASWWEKIPEQWEYFLHNALTQAGLANIPTSAPPLELDFLTGNAA